MKKYDITAYAEPTLSWGEEAYKGVLVIREADKGNWVKAEEAEALQNQLDNANKVLLEAVEEIRKLRATKHAN